MSDTKIQDAFQALQQNMPVVLLYSSARGRHQWGLVQAFSADALPANHLDIKACLLSINT